MLKLNHVYKNLAVWSLEWLKQMKPTVKGNTFAASYRNPVEKHLIPHFGKRKLGDILQADVQAYMNLIAGKFALDTVKKHKSCLFQIFETAVENDLCGKNPARRLKTPKTKERTEKAVYTDEQVKQIINFCYLHRFGAEIQFLLETGVSRGDAYVNFKLKNIYKHFMNIKKVRHPLLFTDTALHIYSLTKPLLLLQNSQTSSESLCNCSGRRELFQQEHQQCLSVQPFRLVRSLRE